MRLVQTVVPRLIGLFALWQIAFVPLANLMEFVPVRQTAADIDPPFESTQSWGTFTRHEPLQRGAGHLSNTLAFWAELTGQDQGWDMFTPGFPPHTVVPLVEVRTAEGTVMRRYSRFDPTQRAEAFRPPLRYDREFNYEANVAMLLWLHPPDAYSSRPDLAATVATKARDNADLLERYIRWKTPRGGTSVESTLILRYVWNDGSGRVEEMPLVRRRWRRENEERPLLEGYDPAAGRFVPLAPWGEP